MGNQTFDADIDRIWAYLTLKQCAIKQLMIEGQINENKNNEQMAMNLAMKYKFVTPMIVVQSKEQNKKSLKKKKMVKPIPTKPIYSPPTKPIAPIAPYDGPRGCAYIYSEEEASSSACGANYFGGGDSSSDDSDSSGVGGGGGRSYSYRPPAKRIVHSIKPKYRTPSPPKPAPKQKPFKPHQSDSTQRYFYENSFVKKIDKNQEIDDEK